MPAELEKLLAGQNKPVPAPLAGPGLVDTGAGVTMVDDAAVEHLALSPVGAVTLGTAGGPKPSALYPIRLAILVAPDRPLVEAEIAQVTSGALRQYGILCLVGRDLLQHGFLAYDGARGGFTIAF